LAAFTILETLWAAQKVGKTVDQEELWHAAQLPPHECERLLDALTARGWIERSEKGAWLAAIAPQVLSPAHVLAAFALDLDAWRQHAQTPGARWLPEQLRPAAHALAQPFASLREETAPTQREENRNLPSDSAG
jgi:ribonuclease D